MRDDGRVPTTRITRLPEKAVAERAALDALLDTAQVAHVGLIADGHPVVIPTAYARDGDRLLVHGSTGSRWMRLLADGAPACVSVTALDGIVVARSAFESSLHYRSAVLFGVLTPVGGADLERALDVLVDRLIPGRSTEVRRSSPRELAATLLLAMPLDEWSLKISDGWPEDEPADVEGPAWAGVVPLRSSYGEPRPAPDLRAGTEFPPSVRRLAGPGC
jgi:nitroimidazol reductase NimA-like FMN-containing flavoprotein (pyridoxamine 5'-phosphate oxidase superfamily)